MARVELTGGHWAELNAPERVTMRERRTVMVKAGLRATAIAAEIGTEGAELYANGFAVIDALIEMLLTGWSLELPLPSEVGAAVLDQLDVVDYQQLSDAVQGVREQIFPTFHATDDNVADGASPTVPSGD